MSQFSFLRANIKDIDWMDNHNPIFVKDLLSDGSKRCIIASNDLLTLIINLSKGKIRFLSLREKVITDLRSFTMPRNSFLLEPFDRALTRLFETGHINLIVKYWAKVHYQFEESPTKVVLTLEHLGVGFQIWLVCLLIALSIFAGEIILRKIS